MASKPKLHSLSDVAKKTGISLPTLQRYKKLYQSRIPSVGSGRTQKYPTEALAEFRKIKRENLKKRGRPRKTAAAGASTTRRKKKARKGATRRKKAAARKKPATRKKAASRRKVAKRGAKRKAVTRRQKKGSLLSLSEIGRRTGISYPTLMRYVKLQLDKIPHVIDGGRRFFPEEAVEAFQRIRSSTRRGRRKGSGRKAASASLPPSGALTKKIRDLEKAQRDIAKQLRSVLDHLKRPLEVTVKRK